MTSREQGAGSRGRQGEKSERRFPPIRTSGRQGRQGEIFTPMPHAPCPMPHAPCQMPHAPKFLNFELISRQSM
ncbi:MAG: hypothetical protein ACRAVC_11900 [Trichormus sp.]